MRVIAVLCFVVDVGSLRIVLDNHSTRDLRYSRSVANSTAAQVWPELVNVTYERVVKHFEGRRVAWDVFSPCFKLSDFAAALIIP